LREKYKPTAVKYLLIAESPPRSDEGRFFYNPELEKWDFLFKSIMEVIFSDFTTGRKDEFLQRFKEEGFYLIDATDTPVNHLRKVTDRNRVIEASIEDKLEEIAGLVSKSTPIFLIKKNVFEIFHPLLKREGYYVTNDEPLPFPSRGWQPVFKEKFSRNLSAVR
jgi:hypothetical protein